VLSSEWVLEPHPGLPRPLCRCWHVGQDKVDGGCGMVTASDLRLLRRRMPPITQVNLSNSAVVTDEWLEALATHHASSLRRLDLTNCFGLSCSQRPLRALQKLQSLEHLRLPAERWDEHELAECLTALPHLRDLDSGTHADLCKAREDIAAQCAILSNVRFGAR